MFPLPPKKCSLVRCEEERRRGEKGEGGEMIVCVFAISAKSDSNNVLHYSVATATVREEEATTHV